MQCPQCQYENREGAKFCEACGSPLDLCCPACDNEARPGAAFCDNCGTSLTSSTLAPGPSQPTQRGTDAEGRFQALLIAVMTMLQRESRITYRTLKHAFGLDDALLEEICEELTLRRLAVDEEGKVLVWTGESQSAVQPAVAIASQPATAETTAITSSAAPALPPPVTETRTLSNGPTVPTEVILYGPVVPVPSCTPADAERRQLSVMFGDLADSTKLSQQHDP